MTLQSNEERMRQDLIRAGHAYENIYRRLAAIVSVEERQNAAGRLDPLLSAIERSVTALRDVIAAWDHFIGTEGGEQGVLRVEAAVQRARTVLPAADRETEE